MRIVQRSLSLNASSHSFRYRTNRLSPLKKKNKTYSYAKDIFQSKQGYEKGRDGQSAVVIDRRNAIVSLIAMSSLVLSSTFEASFASEEKKITDAVFFEFAIDGVSVGMVEIGVYRESSITAERFFTLSKGIKGLSYRRKQIVGIEENEDENVETPLWITSAEIGKFEVPGGGETIDDVPGGLSNENLIKDLDKIKHDRAWLVSVQVRDDPRQPKPEPKSKLVSEKGKFITVYEKEASAPNGTSFSITYAASADLDQTNVVVGEIVSGFDVLEKIGLLPTVPDNSDSPFFQVAKSIGDKRALVSEKSFGKPFAKVTIVKCGEVVKKTTQEEEKSNDL